MDKNILFWFSVYEKNIMYQSVKIWEAHKFDHILQ